MHQVQSIDTVDHITVNRQRQVPRTGTAQWQDPGDVSCEVAQISHDSEDAEDGRNLANSAQR